MEWITDKKKRLGLILIGILLIAVLCCILLLPKGGSQGAGLTFQPDANAADWTSAPSQDSGIQIPGYGEIYFPANSKDVSMTLYNPEANSCNFVFSLYLGDEQTPIYTSGAIAPGKAVTQFTLNEPLEEGSYTLRIQIDTYDLDTQLPLNNAILTTQLTVEA